MSVHSLNLRHYLGGSHAQRDLFVQILLQRATHDDDAASLARLLALRRAMKRDECFADRLTGAAATATRRGQ